MYDSYFPPVPMSMLGEKGTLRNLFFLWHKVGSVLFSLFSLKDFSAAAWELIQSVPFPVILCSIRPRVLFSLGNIETDLWKLHH